MIYISGGHPMNIAASTVLHLDPVFLPNKKCHSIIKREYYSSPSVVPKTESYIHKPNNIP